MLVKLPIDHRIKLLSVRQNQATSERNDTDSSWFFLFSGLFFSVVWIIKHMSAIPPQMLALNITATVKHSYLVLGIKCCLSVLVSCCSFLL